MNVENILKVADAIEGSAIRGLGFNMSYWMEGRSDVPDLRPSHNTCGTTACIAGWAATLAKGRKGAPRNIEAFVDNVYDYNGSFAELGAQWMGLSARTAEALFYVPHMRPDERAAVTGLHAVAVLRHLAETGKVDWTTIPSPVPAVEGR